MPRFVELTDTDGLRVIVNVDRIIAMYADQANMGCGRVKVDGNKDILLPVAGYETLRKLLVRADA